MANHRQRACPLSAMGGDQHRRIELEMALRVGMHIGGRDEVEHVVSPPEQKPAAFPHRIAPRIRQYPLEQRS